MYGSCLYIHDFCEVPIACAVVQDPARKKNRIDERLGKRHWRRHKGCESLSVSYVYVSVHQTESTSEDLLSKYMDKMISSCKYQPDIFLD